MITDKVEILERTIARVKAARKEAEMILEQKSLELFETNRKLASSNKMLEALLNDQATQMKVVVDHSPLGIALIQNGRFFSTNLAFQKIVGYSEEELINKKVLEIAFDNDYEYTKRKISELQRGTIDAFNIKRGYERRDGTNLNLRVYFSLVKDAEGGTKYLIAMLDDITAIERNIKMLETLNVLSNSILGKNNLYEIAWEVARSAAKHLGLEDCVVYKIDEENGEMEQIAAYGNKNPVDFEILNKLRMPIGSGIVGHVAKTGKPELINDTRLDSRYIIDDAIRLSELVVPIIVDGKVVGILDSEHTRQNFFTEQHLEVFTNIANLASAQFNSAINYAKKIEAEKEQSKLLAALEKSNEELNNFAHVVSHDLKSPLRSMNALIHWIKDDPDNSFNEETLTNFELLLKKVDKMDHLINGILKYSSIDKVDQQKQEVNLNLIVKDIIDVIHIPNHVSVTILNELPVVMGDKFKLHQLFQNLLSNAVKYIDKKEGLVEVDVIEKQSVYQFSIKDNGKGIAKEYHDKIFKVFETLEAKAQDSTGIGLSIVKKIIQNNDGDIWLQSKEGEGTTFYFTLKKE